MAKLPTSLKKVEQACCMLWEIMDKVDAHIGMFSQWESHCGKCKSKKYNLCFEWNVSRMYGMNLKCITGRLEKDI